MPLVSALELWLTMAGLSVVTLGVGIIAGRSQHEWQRAPLLVLEIVLLGGVLVGWMFEVWFVAKTFMALGLGASLALLIAIVCGIALVLLAGYVGALLLWAAYSVRGSRARFRPDLRNSLWLSRGFTWRPRDFSSSKPR
jgi:hypothetical protein